MNNSLLHMLQLLKISLFETRNIDNFLGYDQPKNNWLTQTAHLLLKVNETTVI